MTSTRLNEAAKSDINNAIETLCTDAAADELRVGRLMSGKAESDLVEMMFPNFLNHVKDPTHASGDPTTLLPMIGTPPGPVGTPPSRLCSGTPPGPAGGHPPAHTDAPLVDACTGAGAGPLPRARALGQTDSDELRELGVRTSFGLIRANLIT